MQIEKSSDKTKIQQGSIFSIKNIKFNSKIGKKKLGFNDIYPEVNLKNIDYGIILSQSCDLVERKNPPSFKTPYITISLLEPIEKFIEQKYSKSIENLIDEHSVTFDNYRIIDTENLIKIIERNFNKLFSNNETFYFFVSIKSGKNNKIFYINLTKSLPFKIMHYSTFSKNTKYQLKPEFANKLGYMLSYIYGRVGVPDYSESQMKELMEIMLKKCKDAIKNKSRDEENYSIPNSREFKQLKQELSSSKKKDKLSVFKKYTVA